ncbi:MAG: hypothetical protein WED07_00150 [Candidatus Freyarchaeum deiterrae]
MNQNFPSLVNFCEFVRKLELDKAAEIVEKAAKELNRIQGVTPASLSKLGVLMNREVHDKVDIALLKSEIMDLNLSMISKALAEAMEQAGFEPQLINKLRRLVQALVNFYKYYIGDKEGVI